MLHSYDSLTLSPSYDLRSLQSITVSEIHDGMCLCHSILLTPTYRAVCITLKVSKKFINKAVDLADNGVSAASHPRSRLPVWLNVTPPSSRSLESSI